MERYSKLSVLENNMYYEGSPILIEAGELLKDNQDNRVLVHMKLKNIRKETLTYCKISVKAYDPSGNEIEGVDNFAYLDLSVKGGKDFGVKNPIYLPNNITRKVNVAVTEAVFEDGFIWRGDFAEWTPLSKEETIRKVIGDEELLVQFLSDANLSKAFCPKMERGVFKCACGAISLGERCLACGKSYESVSALLDTEKLAEKVQQRKEREKKAQEVKKEKDYQELIAKYEKVKTLTECMSVKIGFEALGDYAEANKYLLLLEEKRKKFSKRKKTITVVAFIVTMLLIAVGIGTYFLIGELKLKKQYDQAQEYLQNNQYAEAYSRFTVLGDYKDSAEYANEATYRWAKNDLENKDYDGAYKKFIGLGTYKDASDCVTQTLFEKACAAVDKGYYRTGIDQLRELVPYASAEEKIEETKELWVNHVKELIDGGSYEDAETQISKMDEDDAKELDGLLQVIKTMQMLEDVQAGKSSITMQDLFKNVFVDMEKQGISREELAEKFVFVKNAMELTQHKSFKSQTISYTSKMDGFVRKCKDTIVFTIRRDGYILRVDSVETYVADGKTYTYDSGYTLGDIVFSGNDYELVKADRGLYIFCQAREVNFSMKKDNDKYSINVSAWKEYGYPTTFELKETK